MQNKATRSHIFAKVRDPWINVPQDHDTKPNPTRLVPHIGSPSETVEVELRYPPPTFFENAIDENC